MDTILTFALRQRVLVAVMFAISLLAGAMAFANLNIEAYPAIGGYHRAKPWPVCRGNGALYNNSH